MLNTYYFTYGTSESYPYQGGWTEVKAPTLAAAKNIFRAVHPDRTRGILNCADFYDEDTFKKTEMWSEGNFGERCVENICLRVEFPEGGA